MAPEQIPSCSARVPSQTERNEGGLLSFLSDIRPDMTPFEAGLGRFCSMDRDVGCLAFETLGARRNPARQVRPVEIAGDPAPPMTGFWAITDDGGAQVGRISSCAWSLDVGCNVAISLVGRTHRTPGTELTGHLSDGRWRAVVRSKFWERH